MATHEDGGWHREVITASTEATLRTLRDAHIVDRFYLAGGTGLALQLGHRLSLDLDFFTTVQFDEETLLQRVHTLAEFSLVAKAPYTLHTTIGETKVSFPDTPIRYSFPRFDS